MKILFLSRRFDMPMVMEQWNVKYERMLSVTMVILMKFFASLVPVLQTESNGHFR
jgi:hypothetical protein